MAWVRPSMTSLITEIIGEDFQCSDSPSNALTLATSPVLVVEYVGSLLARSHTLSLTLMLSLPLSLHCFWFCTLWVISADSMQPAGWPASSSVSFALMNVCPCKCRPRRLRFYAEDSQQWLLVFCHLSSVLGPLRGYQQHCPLLIMDLSGCVTVSAYFWQHFQLLCNLQADE